MAGPLAFLRLGALVGGRASSNGLDVDLRVEGWDAMLKTLDAVARKEAPAACANALNASARRVVTRTAKAIGRAESRKVKDLRKQIRVSKRARAPLDLWTRVVAGVQESIKGAPKVPTSRRFAIPGRSGIYVRALSKPAGYRGPERTPGRPPTSPPNLPIYNITKRRGNDRRRVTLERAARVVLREYYPGEFRRQLEQRLRRRAIRR